jgi:hypothetical protein
MKNLPTTIIIELMENEVPDLSLLHNICSLGLYWESSA